MSSHLNLAEDVAPLAEQEPFRILALSGGGYRGLFAAEVLARIEQRLNSGPLLSQFSMIAGTSVGGLIAAGLVCGQSPGRLCQLIRKHGPNIFDRRFKLLRHRVPVCKPHGPLGGILRSKFDGTALRLAIDEILGDAADMKVAELKTYLLLVSACVTTRTPLLISNIPSASVIADITLRDALLATSAAPGYFPALDLSTRSLVDGGLIANAPDMICLTETMAARLAGLRDCRILSIGTAAMDPAVQPRPIGRRGLLSWVIGDLLPVILFAQERLVVSQASILLGDRMLRIDALPAPEQAKALAIDRSDDASTNTLALLANIALSKVQPESLERWFGARKRP